jgi:hypothetical protein
MKFSYRSLPATLFMAGLMATSAASIGFAAQNYPAGEAFPAPYTDLRGLVDRSQTDLRAAADLESGNEKQRERYRSAQGHLSTFDRHLTKGKFDKGELDKSIDEIKGILDHNVLQASSRDALMRDMGDLRVARDHRY